MVLLGLFLKHASVSFLSHAILEVGRWLIWTVLCKDMVVSSGHDHQKEILWQASPVTLSTLLNLSVCVSFLISKTEVRIELASSVFCEDQIK